MPQHRTAVRTPSAMAAAGVLALLLTATATQLDIGDSEAEARCDRATCGAVGTYIPVTPTRILDGRSNPQVLLGPGGTTELKVTAVAGVPATGVSAVVLNLTVDRPTAASFFTLYPTGGTTATSSLNFAAGETRAAAATVKVGTGGNVTIANAFGQAFPIVDVQGYFSEDADAEAASSYVPLAAPSRVVDTRLAGGTKLAAGETRSIDPGAAVPDDATAVVANLTVTNPTAAGFLTAFPSLTIMPVVSNLNWSAGRSIPNLATVPLGADGKISVFSSAGSSDLLVDVAGYYVPEASVTVGERFTPVPPARLGDSRSGIGGLTTFTTANQPKNLKVTGVGGVPLTGVSAVVVSITSDNVAAETVFTAFPAGGMAVPGVSNLNPAAGENAANLAIIRVGTAGEITLLNRTPTANIIVDVYGWFGGEPPAPATTTTTAGSTSSTTGGTTTTVPATTTTMTL